MVALDGIKCFGAKGNHKGYPYGIPNNGFDKIINNQYSGKIYQIKG